MRNGTSDLGILCSDALPLSHRNSMMNKAIKKLSKLKVYHLSYCTCEHGSIDIADPSMSYLNFEMVLLTSEAQW